MGSKGEFAVKKVVNKFNNSVARCNIVASSRAASKRESPTKRPPTGGATVVQGCRKMKFPDYFPDIFLALFNIEY